MSKLVLFNKPYGVLSQFTAEPGIRTLANYIDAPGCYPAGRLDKDSEGLMLLTNDGKLQHQIANPAKKMSKCYWVQVEGEPNEQALQSLREGVVLKDGITKPAKARLLDPVPDLWERIPPIRVRKTVPDHWIELTISEGRNRQVRRMTAAVGLPTLRLIRYRIGSWTFDGLANAEWRIETL
ncbi:MAG: pseudouridine synthase [Proteobacteria bacterium]|nr:MAG: pseudouridine synthase [Pseudomonadota bacterium]